MIFPLLFAQSRETDPFTTSLYDLSDATLQIETIINNHLDKCRNSSNIVKACHKEIVGPSQFDIIIARELEHFGSNITWVNSIYYTRKPKRWLIAKMGTALGLDIAPTLRIGEYLIGSDKFEHFFYTGYDLSLKSLEEATKWSIKSEKTFFGTQVSGVYSTADHLANMRGREFWLELPTNRSKIFRLNEYFGADFDERLNCNTYTPELLEIVRHNLRLRNLTSQCVS